MQKTLPRHKQQLGMQGKSKRKPSRPKSKLKNQNNQERLLQGGKNTSNRHCKWPLELEIF